MNNYFFTCEIHNQRFPSITALKEHDRNYHSKKRSTIITNNSRLRNISKPTKHTTKLNNSNVSTKKAVSSCNKRVEYQKVFKDPEIKINKEIDDTLFQCHICSLKVLGQRELIKHFEYHTRNPEQCLTLDDNGVYFKPKIKIENDETETNSTQSNIESKNFPCHICKKPFNSIQSRKTHITEDHEDSDFKGISSSGDEDFSDESSESILYEENFISSNSDTNVNVPKIKENIKPKNTYKFYYVCYFCGSKLLSNPSLERHIWSHTLEKPLKCKRCPKAFTRKYELKRHGLYHIKKKKYKCHLCEYSFPASRGLYLHLATHSDEREHSCSYCNKAYKRESSLTRHIQCSHSKCRPFKCNICKKILQSKRCATQSLKDDT